MPHNRTVNVETNQSVHANGEVSPRCMSSLQAWGQKKAKTQLNLSEWDGKFSFKHISRPSACSGHHGNNYFANRKQDYASEKK